MELNIPAIKGIGDSLIYLVDRYPGSPANAGGNVSIYDIDFIPLPGVDQHPQGAGLTYIDHLTHNVHRGRMGEWADFYARIFNFREIRYFDIEGKQTGLVSKAMTSPDGKIRIPLNESRDDKSQIEEFLKDYGGEGIQHIALGTDNIYESVEALARNGIPFPTAPDTYFEGIGQRLGAHGEDVDRLHKNQILIDGAPTQGQGLLLQIFTANQIGPIFFELIQRKGNEGFGEGNFRALFESIEADQVRRGVLTEKA
jgi:4-hydroxyphenylpyruvate dioxygenase